MQWLKVLEMMLVTPITSPSKIARSTGMSNVRAIAEKRFVQSSPLRV